MTILHSLRRSIAQHIKHRKSLARVLEWKVRLRADLFTLKSPENTLLCTEPEVKTKTSTSPLLHLFMKPVEGLIK